LEGVVGGEGEVGKVEGADRVVVLGEVGRVAGEELKGDVNYGACMLDNSLVCIEVCKVLTSIFCLRSFSCLKFAILAARRAVKSVVEMVEKLDGLSLYAL